MNLSIRISSGWHAQRPRPFQGAAWAELMEDHNRNHMPRNSKSSEEAPDDVIQIVRTYLK